MKLNGLMFFWAALIASSFPVAAAITAENSPLATTFLRFLLATLLFLPLAAAKLSWPIRPHILLRYLIISATLVLFFVAMFEALRYTSAVNTGAIYTLMPLVSVVLTFWLLKTVTPRLRVCGFVLGAVGALLVVLERNSVALADLTASRGDLIFFLGSISMAMYSLLSRKWLSEQEPMVATFWILLFGTVLLAPFAFFDSGSRSMADWSIDYIAGLLYLAVFTTLLTFFIQQYAIQQVGPNRLLAFSYLTPALIGVGEAIWWSETIIGLLPGCGLICLAMLLIQRKEAVVKQPA